MQNEHLFTKVLSLEATHHECNFFQPFIALWKILMKISNLDSKGMNIESFKNLVNGYGRLNFWATLTKLWKIIPLLQINKWYFYVRRGPFQNSFLIKAFFLSVLTNAYIAYFYFILEPTGNLLEKNKTEKWKTLCTYYFFKRTLRNFENFNV